MPSIHSSTAALTRRRRNNYPAAFHLPLLNDGLEHAIWIRVSRHDLVRQGKSTALEQSPHFVFQIPYCIRLVFDQIRLSFDEVDRLLGDRVPWLDEEEVLLIDRLNDSLQDAADLFCPCVSDIAASKDLQKVVKRLDCCCVVLEVSVLSGELILGFHIEANHLPGIGVRQLPDCMSRGSDLQIFAACSTFSKSNFGFGQAHSEALEGIADSLRWSRILSLVPGRHGVESSEEQLEHW
jgi:hypothetical protein